MTSDTREAIVSIGCYISRSSSRTTIDYPTYYLGTTWSTLISVRRLLVCNVNVIVTQPMIWWANALWIADCWRFKSRWDIELTVGGNNPRQKQDGSQWVLNRVFLEGQLLMLFNLQTRLYAISRKTGFVWHYDRTRPWAASGLTPLYKNVWIDYISNNFWYLPFFYFGLMFFI